MVLSRLFMQPKRKMVLSEYSISPVQVQARAYKGTHDWLTLFHQTPRALIG
jgi:hypothetical protein